MRSLLLITALLASTVATAAPGEFTHQGRLSDSTGVPLEGFNTVTFSVHPSRTGGSALWSETHTLDFDNGYYNIILGSQNAFNKDDFNGSDDLFLGMAINGGAQLPDRTELTSVPWAIWAQGADTATTAENVSGGIVDASEIRINGTTVIDSSGTATVSWNDLDDVPSDFADGSDDGFTPPSCSTEEIIRWNGSLWACAAADDHNHNANSITDGVLSINRIPVGSDENSVAAGNHTHNGIESLDCSDGEFAKYSASTNAWECASAGGGGGSLLLNIELDENSGTSFADTSGGGNNAETTGGGLAVGSAGHTNKAVVFTGGVVTVPEGNSVTDSPYVTAEAWAQPTNVTSTGVVVMREGAWKLSRKNADIIFEVTTPNGVCTATGAGLLAEDEWSHVMGSYNGRRIRVSVNDIGVETTCTNGPVVVTNGGAIHIGADGTGGNSTAPFTGFIDEVRVWAHATNQSDDSYACGVNGPCPDANGGTITSSGGNRIHTFTSNGTFVAPTRMTVKLLVVGGGGGGGNHNTTNANGGGGGGGVVYKSSYVVEPGSYSVVVGAGGSATTTASNTPGGNGGNSSFDGIVATGGGGGGSPAGVGKDGGSGGGGAYYSYSPGYPLGLNDIEDLQRGHEGGVGNYTWTGGGGGGAGSPGVAGNVCGNCAPSGNGGRGISSDISGTTRYYGGGGGGGGNSSERAGDGYDGGGRGHGTTSQYNYNNYPNEVNSVTHGSGTMHAIPNTGGGGGAGSYWGGNVDNPGAGRGATGVVIISYEN